MDEENKSQLHQQQQQQESYEQLQQKNSNSQQSVALSSENKAKKSATQQRRTTRSQTLNKLSSGQNKPSTSQQAAEMSSNLDQQKSSNSLLNVNSEHKNDMIDQEIAVVPTSQIVPSSCDPQQVIEHSEHSPNIIANTQLQLAKNSNQLLQHQQQQQQQQAIADQQYTLCNSNQIVPDIDERLNHDENLIQHQDQQLNHLYQQQQHEHLQQQQHCQDSSDIDQNQHMNQVHQDGRGSSSQEQHHDDEEEEEEDPSDPNYKFYKEYCRLYYANIILTNRLQQLLNEKQDLQFKLNRLESNKRAHEEALGMTFEIAEEKRKRHRRTATEISRHYVCPIEDCPKSYGSEGSLNQHLKLKHNDYYQKQVIMKT